MTEIAPTSTIDVAELTATILAQVRAETSTVNLATNVLPMVKTTTNVGILGINKTRGASAQTVTTVNPPTGNAHMVINPG